MKFQTFNHSLIDFIGNSPTPYHAVKHMVDVLVQNGYERLEEQDKWEIKEGKYFVTRNGSSLIAFRLPKHSDPVKGVHMAGAHTDSPCLHVKPDPVVTKHGYTELGVEVYGGALLNPWFDRDLSMAGRVIYLDRRKERHDVLVDFRQPVAIIPSLAIHLDRKANEERAINAQTDIMPILMQSGDAGGGSFNDLLIDRIRLEHRKKNIDRILGHDLSLYDTQGPAITGVNGDFISGARLDNLLSCYVGMMGLIDAQSRVPALLVCNDHEEVGSASSSGAQGPFLKTVLQRIAGSMEDMTRLVHHSLMISCDNAHGIHPNYSDRHDGNHGPLLNHGPVVKHNASQRYATNSETAAIFKQYCHHARVPVQEFVMRSDMACGSTIGPITAAEVGVRTVDVGVPQFAMHSVRETCGSKDPYSLYKVLKAFYTRRM